MQAMEKSKPTADVGPSAFIVMHGHMTCHLPPPDKTIAAAKKQLRSIMIKTRENAHTLNPQAALQLRDIALQHLVFPPQCKVASYHNFGSEISPHPLTDVLRMQGHTILLPVIAHKSSPLLFRVHKQSDILIPGWQGILEPPPSAPLEIPDILFVPLLAFNRHFYRLGYGGGYYDRTLAELRKQKNILAIGMAFASQEKDDIPLNSNDVQLDKIVTEVEFLG